MTFTQYFKCNNNSHFCADATHLKGWHNNAIPFILASRATLLHASGITGLMNTCCWVPRV
jgi:hypothetical protein